MISPTGKGIRRDSKGSGLWGAPRGTRNHMGVDFLCEPDQIIYAPFKMEIYRESRPYSDDHKYTGVAWRTAIMDGRMFYFVPYATVVGGTVLEDQAIGTAQNIAEKYGKNMLPHIHFEIKSIDPLVIMDLLRDIKKFL